MRDQDLDSGPPQNGRVLEKADSLPKEIAAGDGGTTSAAHNNKERRRWPRFAVDIPVQVRITTREPTQIVAGDGHAIDLNGGGLALQTDIGLPIGAQIAVAFTPPLCEQPMTFRCFVRQRTGHRYRAEFVMENEGDYRKAGELRARLAAFDPQSSLR